MDHNYYSQSSYNIGGSDKLCRFSSKRLDEKIQLTEQNIYKPPKCPKEDIIPINGSRQFLHVKE